MAKIAGVRCVKCRAELTYEVPKDPKLIAMMIRQTDRAALEHGKECDGTIVSVTPQDVSGLSGRGED